MIMPSGMLTRHLETSEGAQPDSIRRPIAADDDLAVMMASNADMTTTLATPDEAAEGVIEAILAGHRYIITHGDLTAAIEDRHTELRRAADAAKT